MHCEDHVLAGHPRSIVSCAGVAASVDRKGLLNLQSTCGGEPGMVGGRGRGWEQEFLVMEGAGLLPIPVQTVSAAPWGAEGMLTRF